MVSGRPGNGGGVPASASTGWVGPAYFPGAPSPRLIPEPGLGGVVQVHPLESRPRSSPGNWRWGGTEASRAAVTPLHGSLLITRLNYLTSETKEANTNSASISDDTAASLWRGSAESEPAVKQKGKREAGHPCVPYTGCPGVMAAAAGSQASDPAEAQPLVIHTQD